MHAHGLWVQDTAGTLRNTLMIPPTAMGQWVLEAGATVQSALSDR